MSVFGASLAAPQDPAQWSWVAPRLGQPSTVSSLVPNGFERYARIDHAIGEEEASVGLPTTLLPRLVRFLGALTTTPDRACFAVWEGFGWSNEHLATVRSDTSSRRWRRSSADPFAHVAEEMEASREALEAELESLPSVRAGHRTYRVLSGPLDAVLEMHDPIAVWSPRVPELWWPSDGAWFVGTDAEITWTYVAGRGELVDILLEGWPERVRPVEPTDAIA